jgi:hypothetical protein
MVPLVLKADVIPDFNYSPKEAVFTAGRASAQTIAFSPGRLSNISLVRAYCTQRAFTAKVVDTESCKQVEILFEPRDWFAEEDLVHYLVVETTSPNEPTCRIPLVIMRPSQGGRMDQ